MCGPEGDVCGQPQLPPRQERHSSGLWQHLGTRLGNFNCSPPATRIPTLCEQIFLFHSLMHVHQLKKKSYVGNIQKPL